MQCQCNVPVKNLTLKKMPLLTPAIPFIILQSFKIRLKRLTKTLSVKKAGLHAVRTRPKCIYIVKIYLLERKHYRQASREPGTMFGARAIQRRREKEEELKV